MQTVRFTKKQLTESKTFPYSPDVTGAVLEDGGLYSRDEAEWMILCYLKESTGGKEN